jgi:glycosyltransferase involved in cell wall biosynthesis
VTEPESQFFQPSKTHEPIVSIGMPVYNAEKFIKEAVDSLLAQTFKDFELIISDNASTDGTEVICREYAEKDPRIRYVRQLENHGAIANFNFVLGEAQGKYFMWAAHDDHWMPEFISASLHVLENDGQAVCVVPKVKFTDGRLSDATTSITGNPRQRLKAFLSNPGDNSRFYGLHRTEILRKAIFEFLELSIENKGTDSKKE